MLAVCQWPATRSTAKLARLPNFPALGKLRLGRISYLNTEPFFASDAIRSRAIARPPRQVYDLTAAGEVDAAPLPSVAWADHPDTLSPIGNFGIAAAGAVDSVLLRCQVEPDRFDRATVVGVTDETVTSLRLLKVLFHEHWNVVPRLRYDRLGPDNDAQLVIGDEALGVDSRFPIAIDLGQAWQEFSGLPFVYALWLSGPDAQPEGLAELTDYFSTNLARNGADVAEIAERRPGLGMTGEQIESYLAKFAYRLGDDERAGLAKFFELDARRRKGRILR